MSRSSLSSQKHSNWARGTSRGVGRKGRGQVPGSPDSGSGKRTGVSVLMWGLRRIVWPLFKWGTIVFLPFIVLMRVALFVYQHEWPVPLALGMGFLAAFCVLFLYVTWAYFWVAGGDAPYHARTAWTKALVVLVVLGLFQGYVLLSPDPAHVKSDAVHAEYSRLHPLLRTSLATMILVDEHLLITDLSRHPSDYEAMGLPTNPRSLHYPQADGYVHAVDLRTKGHYEIRNLLMRGYFAALGFRTLRHVGTADHLHVALPHPNASVRSGSIFDSEIRNRFQLKRR